MFVNVKISHFLRLSLFGKHYLSQYCSGSIRYTCCFRHVYVSLFHLRVEMIREPSDWPFVQRSLAAEPAIFITTDRHWVLTLAKNCSRHSTTCGSSFNPHETLWGEHHHYAHVELSATHYYYLHKNSWFRVTQLLSGGVWIQTKVWLQIWGYWTSPLQVLLYSSL